MPKETEQQEATTKELAYQDSDALMLGLPTIGALNLLTKFCNQLVGSPFVPKAFEGNPAALMGAVLKGREMQLAPMQALEAFFPSPDGRLGMYATSMMAVMRKAGIKFEWLRDDDTGCSLKGTRPDGETYTSVFTLEDAERAGLTKREKSQWPKYPRRMCKWRVIGDMFRTLASDLCGGPIYGQDEIEEIEDNGRGPAPEPPMPKVGRRPKPEEAKPATGETIEVKAETVGPEPETKESTSEGPQLVPKPDTPAAAPAEAKTTKTPKSAAARSAYQDHAQRILENMTELSVDAARLRLQKFVRGYLGVTEVPKEYDKLKPALDLAETLLAGGARKAFLDDPTGIGRVYGPGGETLRALFAKQEWTTATQELAMRVMSEMEVTPDGFTRYLASNGVTDYGSDDANAFFQLFLVTRKNAYLVTDLAAEYNRPFAMLFNRILELVGEGRDWNSDNVDAAITALDAELKGKPKGEPPQAADPKKEEVRTEEEPPEQEGSLWTI